MRKHLLISILATLVLAGGGCLGSKTPAPATPAPSANANLNVGSGSPHVPTSAAAAFGADVTMEIGDTATYPDGFSMTLTAINDSRCPKDVQCIWQGELSPVLSISGGAAGAEPKEVFLGTVRTLQTLAAGYAFALREATDTSIKINITKDTSVVAQTDTRIRVTSPKPGALVKSPLTVTGEARGTWYFEASFPIELQDANGKSLLQVPAQAQGEWMTEDFVPFSVTLTFPKPDTATGTLILHKDNPSGLPQHDAQINIPVTF